MIATAIRILMLVAGLAAAPARAEPAGLEIWIDADFSIVADGARAIEAGIRAALEQSDYTLGGLPVRVVARDHRGNAKRSRATVEALLASDRALALIGGVHSPPYLISRDFLNESKVLTLLPWSAGGAITRSAPGSENWIFRLSVDDTKAGEFLVSKAVDIYGCKAPALLLLDTAWGRGAEPLMQAALAERGVKPADVFWIPSMLGQATGAALAGQIAAAGPDCGILLANTVEAVALLRSISAQDPKMRIVSHWGIVAGPFADAVGHETREALSLRVLQTCGLRSEAEGRPPLKAAFAAAPGNVATDLGHMSGATGFVHAYDMMLLLRQAVAQIAEERDWKDGSIEDRRRLVKGALENLQGIVPGILRNYYRPFLPYRPEWPDAHEALGVADLCIARFEADGSLALDEDG